MKKLTLSKVLLFVIALINMSFEVHKNASKPKLLSTNTTYYFSSSGNDINNGTKESPWRTIKKFNRIQLHPGDSVLFEGGQTFTGNIKIDSLDSGNMLSPVSISSYGDGFAIINGGYRSAISVSHAQYLFLKNLRLIGAGRKEGNTREGISISSSKNITISYLDISGFQKAGLLIYSSANINATHVYAHENGASGISVEGTFGKKDSRDIYLGYCRATSNAGDPSNLTNHSGNGIIVGNCRKVTIDYCEATYNGWDMPRIGNGPVGIWGYEADSLIIQHCLSYRNKTSHGGQDGGGFDLDGGVTNSIIQYCLSYENQGAGYGIFQYGGAGPWYNNVFRYNISRDDGLVSGARGGIYIWNGSGDENQFYDCLFYNNTIYNTRAAAISYSSSSKRKNFVFYNNIFVAQDSLIRGQRGVDSFLANNWWSITKDFNIERIYDFVTWAKKNNQEMMDGNIVGLNMDPDFRNSGDTMPISSSTFKFFDQYYIPENSPLLNSGLDLHSLFGIETGSFDFNHQPALLKGMGACFATYKKSADRPECPPESPQALYSQLMP